MLAQIARTAESAGFYSLWLHDHFFQVGDRERTFGVGPAEDETLEAYSTLNYLAALTQRVKLGALVTGVIYRYPGILVKTATTLDVLSGGRAYFGVGAAWYEREARGLGVPFPSTAERFACLEEALQIAKQMWSANDGPYHGRHYSLAETLNNPQPLSRPHPPILIGGMGEQKTLRLVAQYADACNLFAHLGTENVRAKLGVLARHCDAVGRDCATIEKTTTDIVRLAPDRETPAGVIERYRTLAALGIEHAIFSVIDVHEIAPLETFGREIIPQLAAL